MTHPKCSGMNQPTEKAAIPPDDSPCSNAQDGIVYCEWDTTTIGPPLLVKLWTTSVWGLDERMGAGASTFGLGDAHMMNKEEAERLCKKKDGGTTLTITEIHDEVQRHGEAIGCSVDVLHGLSKWGGWGKT